MMMTIPKLASFVGASLSCQIGYLRHFSHRHPLTLLDADSDSKAHFCFGCQDIVSGPSYGCSHATPDRSENEWEDCSIFALCKSCAELPSEIKHHPFHPEHRRLALLANSPNPYLLDQFSRLNDKYCNACGWNVQFAYYCDECPFSLHTECALLLKPTTNHEGHCHPLILLDREYHTQIPYATACNACGALGAVFARCVNCNINFHVQCDLPDQLPPTITYKAHEHPLTLSTSSPVAVSCSCCDACKKQIMPNRFVYTCAECNKYIAHVRCVISELQLNQKERYEHCSHPDHPLFLYDDISNGTLCKGCKSPIKGLTYGCKLCDFFLDKSCIERPQDIDHPFHPPHPLTLQVHDQGFTCNICRKDCNGYIFGCRQCGFGLDLECASLMPYVTHEDHKHPLTIVEEIKGCPETSYLYCILCDIRFDVLGGPLPDTVKHKCHFHALTLRPYLIEEDLDEHYCDVCEEVRDRNGCVYYCAECQYEAHVRCVMSEVQRALRGELEGVTLVTVKNLKWEEERKINSEIDKLPCFTDIYDDDNIPENDMVEIDRFVQITKLTRVFNNYSLCSGALPVSDILKDIYSEEPLRQFMDKIKFEDPEIRQLQSTMEEFLSFFGEEDELEDSDGLQNLRNKVIANKALEVRVNVFWSFLDMLCSCAASIVCEKVVEVGGYTVIKSSAPIIKDLMTKYGDFSAKSKFCTVPTKLLFFTIVYEIISNMLSVRVKEVTESLLLDWWYKLKYLELIAGFKLDFMFDKLDRVAHAHFALRADRYADNILTKVRKEVSELPRKMKLLDKELRKKKKRMQGLKIEEEQVRAARSNKSCLMKEWLEEGEETRCDFIGAYFRQDCEESVNSFQF